MRDLKSLTRGAARRAYRLQQRLRAGRRPVSEVDGRSAADVTAQLSALTETGDHAGAIALATTQLASSLSGDAAFLDQVRASASKAGAMSLQREATALRLSGARGALDGPALERVERAGRLLDGRWLETSADWRPTVDPAVLTTLAPVTDPRPGRILHVLKISMPHRQSGYSVRSMYTLVAERDGGLDPVAVTALDFPSSVGVTDAPEQEDVAGIPHHRLERDRTPDREPADEHLDAWATELARVVSRERPSVIHVHSGQRGYDAALVGLAVGQALGVPVVYEVRGFFEALWTKDLAWAEQSEVYRRRRDTETRCMMAADAVVTLSESMRADILERGVPADRVHVVPNGVDTTAFAPRERDPELVARLGLEGRFTFGYVSNLDHYREGQELLIDAAVALRERGIPATALIVGDGTRRSFLEAHAAAVGAGDSVIFTGKVPHDSVLDHYCLLDVFVIPRVDERAARLVTPLKPFEAMAAGIPLLVSDLPALVEITGNGSRGASFAAGDGVALADALEHLHADPARRAALAEAGRDWVVRERQWSSNGPRYRAIYDEVLARR
ncbi:glycosyltransferase family 4 protein [Janibacter sp. G56]|uniref:glycosyltransferase family 4 protein n=1 Tax=Janibacter sp. G56 TaxID=3418717 RepID=UPI003CFC7B9C